MGSAQNQCWDGAANHEAGRSSLNPDIWCTTPEDIQLCLLKFLPVTSLCRFRCVSKSWCSAIATTDPSSKMYFLTARRESLQLFDGHTLKLIPMPREHPGMFSVSTSAGLVLAAHESWHPFRFSLSVHNPFVPGSSRALGRIAFLRGLPPAQEVVFVGIHALRSTLTDQGRISFAVVCVTSSDQGYGGVVHVFDSRSWRWVVESARLMDGDDECLCVWWNRSQSSFLLQDERLYFITVSGGSSRKSLRSVGIWDPEHTREALPPLTNLPLDLSEDYIYPSIISCQGKKLVLVNLSPSPPPLGSIGFVYLDEERRCWRVLRTFPVVKELKQDDWVSAWGGGPESSLVTLLFQRRRCGCILDLAASTCLLVSGSDELRSFQPSFFTF